MEPETRDTAAQRFFIDECLHSSISDEELVEVLLAVSVLNDEDHQSYDENHKHRITEYFTTSLTAKTGGTILNRARIVMMC